jgi:NAD(P)-dependent dehydrogenase (short-subunit alcohol dehydrogenase family)
VYLENMPSPTEYKWFQELRVHLGSEGFTGKTCVVTGANTGIGKQTALCLALLGGDVVMACRSAEKANVAIADIRKYLDADGGGRVRYMPLDLNDLKSVKAFASSFRDTIGRLDLLVNNAGINSMGKTGQMTADGFEQCYGINFLGHFLLTRLLLDCLAAGAKESQSPSRVVNLSSVMHRSVANNVDFELQAKQSTGANYSVSKLAMICFSREINRLPLWKTKNIMAVSCNPGAVNSDIWRTVQGFQKRVLQYALDYAFLDVVQGCASTVYAAASPDVRPNDYIIPYYPPCSSLESSCCFGLVSAETVSSVFEYVGPFWGPQKGLPSALSASDANARSLWETSSRLVAHWLDDDAS